MKIILKNSNLCFLKNNYRNITNEIYETFEEYALGHFLSSDTIMSSAENKSFYYNTIDVIPNEEYILNIDTTDFTGGGSKGYVITSSEDKTNYTKDVVLKVGPNIDSCTDLHIIIPQGAKLMFIQRYAMFNSDCTKINYHNYKVSLYKKI